MEGPIAHVTKAAAHQRKAGRPSERESAGELQVRIYFFKADLLDFSGAGKQSFQKIILFFFVERPGKIGTRQSGNTPPVWVFYRNRYPAQPLGALLVVGRKTSLSNHR